MRCRIFWLSTTSGHGGRRNQRCPGSGFIYCGHSYGSGGTDTALETADIALMADDLAKLPYTIRLSRKTLRIIKQNIVLSLAIKAAISLVIPGWLTLWLAVVGDMGSSLLVTLNGMRCFG